MDDATLAKHAEAILRAAGDYLSYGQRDMHHADFLTALRAAVDDGAPRWRPIETAPDGEWVISWGPDGHGLLKLDPTISPHIRDTHWMPLPDAPVADHSLTSNPVDDSKTPFHDHQAFQAGVKAGLDAAAALVEGTHWANTAIPHHIRALDPQQIAKSANCSDALSASVGGGV